ncbi:MAG TPA: lipid A export permease/ATP-binding protein MsbA [Magnetospirillaceae bacterium]
MSNKKLHLDQSTWTLVRRLVREGVRPYVGRIFISFLFMAVVAATSGLLAWLMKPVVDEVFVKQEADMLWPIAGAVVAVSVLKGIATYYQSYFISWVGFRIINDMQNRLFTHLMRMDLQFFHNNATGTLVSRFTNDINQMRAAVSNALAGIGRDSLSVIALVGVMFYQDWRLGLISFFAFPTAVYPIQRFGKRLRRVVVNTQEHLGDFVSQLDQSFQGMRVVKAYGMERYEEGKVAGITETIFQLVFKQSRVRARSSPIMEALGGMAIAAVIVYGGLSVVHGTTTPGAFFSFMTAFMMAYQPVKNLSNLYPSLQEGLAGAERLFIILDIEPTILEKPDAKPLAIRGGAVRLENVLFRYDESRRALDGITLDVPAGKRVALVGLSGAGKSTVLNLIPRFYDVNEGRVLVDGQDVRDVTLSSLRAGMALVSQEILLFDDTVRANIAYGCPETTDADVEAAARHAAAHDFIAALPQGYDTMVGEHGAKLSGGQRQRLAIARAMLRNAPILLLDEATSALDTESERQVQTALEALMEGRTTIIVAHRLSTIADADLIHVIDRGRVAESGRHGELMARGGLYARLYAVQSAEDDDTTASPPRVALGHLG